MARILVVDDEESIRFTFETFLADEGHTVLALSGLTEALRCLAKDPVDLVFADVILRDGSGFDVLEHVRRRDLRCPVILINGFLRVETALLALRLGAFDYFQKPVRQETLLEVTERAIEHRGGARGRDRTRSNLHAILENVSDSIVLLDRSMAVLQINEAALRRCGVSRDIIGKKLEPPCEDCRAECLDLVRATLERGVEVGPEWLFCGAEGRMQRPASVTTYPLIDADGRFSGAILTIVERTGFRA